MVISSLGPKEMLFVSTVQKSPTSPSKALVQLWESSIARWMVTKIAWKIQWKILFLHGWEFRGTPITLETSISTIYLSTLFIQFNHIEYGGVIYMNHFYQLFYIAFGYYIFSAVYTTVGYGKNFYKPYIRYTITNHVWKWGEQSSK